MTKRLIDIVLSFLSLTILSPVFLVAAMGIRLSSPGPIVYRDERVGLAGKPFTMHKFRTMYVRSKDSGSSITAINDSRVFSFGVLLRKLKIDELPQLYDVLRGKMSIVGPRPENIEIVKKHYSQEQKKTLSVLPGLASPGSIFNYTHGHLFLSDDDPEGSYIKELLPVKLGLDNVYVNEHSLLYDLRIVFRTIFVVVSQALGKKDFPEPPEMKK